MNLAYSNNIYIVIDRINSGAALTLAGIMYMRWSKSGKFMPAGIICALSAASILRNIVVYRQHLSLPGASQ